VAKRKANFSREAMTEEEWAAYVLLMFAKTINPDINSEEAYEFCYAYLQDDTGDLEAAIYWGDLIAGTVYTPEPGLH
jgi:hypothetical protein